MRKKCKQCGKEFTTVREYQKYCSTKCSKAHYYRQRKIYDTESSVVGQQNKCEFCGKHYIATSTKQRFCSSACQKKNKAARGMLDARGRSAGGKRFDRANEIMGLYDKKKCAQCEFAERNGAGKWTGENIICAYGLITGRNCIRRGENGKLTDIRGDNKMDCQLFIKTKGKRKYEEEG